MRVLHIAVGVAIGFVIYHQLSDPLRAENRRLRAENARLSLENKQNKEDAEKFRQAERSMGPLYAYWDKEREEKLSKMTPQERTEYHIQRAIRSAELDEEAKQLQQELGLELDEADDDPFDDVDADEVFSA
jgi:hypothetical protein